MPRNPKLTPEVMQRQAEAARLAVLGYTYEQIAERLGYADESGVRYAINSHFKRRATETFEEMRPILVERAEVLWQRALNRMAKAEQRTRTLPDGTVVPDPDEEAWARAHAAASRSLDQQCKIHGIYDSRPQVQVNVDTTQSLERMKSLYTARLDAMRQAALTVDGEVVAEKTT